MAVELDRAFLNRLEQLVLFEGALDDVVDVVMRIAHSANEARRTAGVPATLKSVERQDLSWVDAPAFLGPIRFGPERGGLLIPVCPAWTAYIGNHPSPAFSKAWYYTREVQGARALATETMPDCKRWWVYRSGEKERVVQLLLDDSWQFSQHGPVQSYEEPEHYRRPRIEDRLPSELVYRYLTRVTGRQFPVDWTSPPFKRVVGLRRVTDDSTQGA